MHQNLEKKKLKMFFVLERLRPLKPSGSLGAPPLGPGQFWCPVTIKDMQIPPPSPQKWPS